MKQLGRSIVLIGMMGAGKSSVGQCLQRRTGLALLDTDDIVTSNFRMSIPEIFARRGEKEFRKAEAEAVGSVAGPEPKIIVTGGGIVLRKENTEILKRLGVTVWLDGDEETLFARVVRKTSRPLLQAKNRRRAFSHILATRRCLYARIADIRIDTSVLTDEEVAVAILAKLRRANAKTGSPIPATPS